MLEIITIGHETLTMKAMPVENFDDTLKNLVDEMFLSMEHNRGIGLAASQVNVKKRIFLVNIEKDKPRVFINPELLSTSPQECSYEEGCLSLPGLYFKLVRPESIRIQAWNERGRPFTLDADGLLSRVIQHELDHLNGILFVDRLSPQARVRAMTRYEKLLRI